MVKLFQTAIDDNVLSSWYFDDDNPWSIKKCYIFPAKTSKERKSNAISYQELSANLEVLPIRTLEESH